MFLSLRNHIFSTSGDLSYCEQTPLLKAFSADDPLFVMFAREVRWLGVLSGSFPIACTRIWGYSVTIDFAFNFELALWP